MENHLVNYILSRKIFKTEHIFKIISIENRTSMHKISM